MRGFLKRDFNYYKPSPVISIGAGLFVFFAIFYWSGLRDLVLLWSTEKTYSHGFLVPAISIYLILQQNELLKITPIKPALLLTIPLSLTLLLWFFATITDTKTVELTLLPFIYIFAYLSIVGYQAGIILIGALFFIVFAVPIWSVLTPLLQNMAIIVNEFALKLSGIPTFIENTIVSIPAGEFEIEGGCSGIRYLLVTLCIGSFYSLLNRNRLRSAVIIIALSVIFPIVLNWMRIYIIILIGHFSNMQNPMVNDHDTFGWILYGISLIPFIFFIQNSTFFKNKKNIIETVKLPDDKISKYKITYAMIPLFLIVGIATLSSHIKNRPPEIIDFISPPKAQHPWLGPINSNTWKPEYLGASIESNVSYIGEDGTPDISLHLYYYGQQSQGRELINELNSIADNRAITLHNIVTHGQHNIIENIIITRNKKKRLVWYWYNINNKNTIKPLTAKLHQAQEIISGRATSSLIAISTECITDCLKQIHYLNIFLNKHHDHILNSITNR